MAFYDNSGLVALPLLCIFLQSLTYIIDISLICTSQTATLKR